MTISSNKTFFLISAALLLVVLLVISIYSSQKKRPAAENPSPAPGPIIPTITTSAPGWSGRFSGQEIVIDTTEDNKALGYTGQRKLTYGPDGELYAAYRKKYLGRYQIFVARISGTDQPIVSGNQTPIANIPAASQRVPSIAVGPDGTLHAVWYGSDTPNQENNRQIKYASSKDQGQTWSSWKNISVVDGYSFSQLYWQEHPSMGIAPDGTLYAVWEGKDSQNAKQQIKFSRSSDGGNTWTAWKNIAPGSGTQSRPTLLVGPDGTLHLFMYSSQGNALSNAQQIQYAASHDQGNSWSDWQVVSEPQFDSRHLSAAIGPDGTIHIAWRSGASPTQPSQILYSALSHGEWNNILPLPTSDRFQFFPSLGTDISGRTYVAWMETPLASSFPQEDPANGSAFLSFLDGEAFRVPAPINDRSGLYPNVAERGADPKTVPVLYLEQKTLGQNDIKLKFVGE